ncbi:MAG: response regulator [Granulosicoccus sp.]
MSETTNILLVEDDRHIALALQIRLCAAGHSVHLAANVAEAQSLLQEQVLDVAVIDVNLPDGNGIDLMRASMTQDTQSPIIPIIMSASRKPGLREQALEAGASAFLEKPFSSLALMDAIALGGAANHAR